MRFRVNAALQEAMSITYAAQVRFRNGNWHGSITDGLDRFLFTTSGTSFWKGHGTGTIHEWRNGSDSNVMSLTDAGLLTVVGALGVGASPGVNRLHLAAATAGSSVTYLNSIVSAKANADTSAHFRLTRTGISEWYVKHNGAGNLELALAGNLANPDFTFGGGGVFIANNQIIS